jgi:hypothetical protein
VPNWNGSEEVTRKGRLFEGTANPSRGTGSGAEANQQEQGQKSDYADRNPLQKTGKQMAQTHGSIMRVRGWTGEITKDTSPEMTAYHDKRIHPKDKGKASEFTRTKKMSLACPVTLCPLTSWP